MSFPVCSQCRRPIKLRADGLVRAHGPHEDRCAGSNLPPYARPRVSLACLQGRHTDTCGHVEPYVAADDLEPEGVRFATEHHNHTFTKDGPGLSRCACGTTINRTDRGRPILEREDTDPHTWHTEPDALRSDLERLRDLEATARVYDEQTGAITLTDDETSQVIAGHTELHPAAALRAVRAILAGRLAR